MGHKCSRHKKKFRKLRERKIRKSRISQDDVETIELLYGQIDSLLLFFISDAFLFRYGQYAIYQIISEEIFNEKSFLCSEINFIKGNLLALTASYIELEIYNKRYINQCRRKEEGKINYSLNAEKNIVISAILLIILYFVQLIGAISIYRINFTNAIKSRIELIKFYIIQLKAFQIRFLADCFLLQSTISSIKLIESKYIQKNHPTENYNNPDIPAVIAGQLYFIQRVILLYSEYNIYNSLLQENTHYILQPHFWIIIGSIIGVLGNGYSLNGFIEIYMRNLNQPVFGR